MRGDVIKTASWAPQFGVLAHGLLTRGLPWRSTIIYNGRNHVARVHDSGREVCIKAFKVPHIINRFVYGNLRTGKARRSFEHAIRLRNLGFNTPEPLAYAEEGGLLFGRSYYVCQYLPDFSDIRDLSKLDEHSLATMADELGALMARLHDSGIWMKDFSQGNILYRRTPKGGFDFYLIDINRMEFGVTDHRHLMQNFKAVTESPRFLDMLARAYARHARLPEGVTVLEARRVRARFLASAARKKVIKRILHPRKKK